MAKTRNQSSSNQMGTSSSLQPRPMVPATDPYEAILAQVKSVQSQCAMQTDPEQVQASIRKVDETLKKISQLQKDVGLVRRELGKQVQNIRQANPRGLPAEGTVRDLPNGGKVIFLGGSWQPYMEASLRPEED